MQSVPKHKKTGLLTGCQMRGVKNSNYLAGSVSGFLGSGNFAPAALAM